MGKAANEEAPAVVFGSGAVLVRRSIAKHPEAWYYVEKWPPAAGQTNEREACTWVPDEVAEWMLEAATQAVCK